MSYTTDDLQNAILRRSFAPAGQLTFTAPELLAMADEVVNTYLLADILAVREEFFVNYVDLAVTAGQQAYDIPARAVAMKVREIHLIGGATLQAGVPVGGTAITNLPRREPEQLTTIGTGSIDSFFLRDDQICLYPTPATSTGVLRVYFFLRPGIHVATSAAGVVASFNTGLAQVTLAAIPSSWATGNAFDLSRKDGGQRPYLGASDLTSSLVSGSTITLPSLPAGLRVGDYVSLAGQTAVVALPPEYRDILAQGVAADALAAMNQPGADKARQTFDAMRKNGQRLITPRVEGEDRRITPVNWFMQ